MTFRPSPIVAQFDSMKVGPFEYERQRPAVKAPFQHSQRVDREDRFLTSINRVEMRRRVVVKVHPNHNSKELANRRHASHIRSLRILKPGQPAFTETS